MQEFLENGPKFWVAYGCVAFACFFLWTKLSEGNAEDSKGGFAKSFVFLIFSALLLSAPLGWQISEMDRKNKEEQVVLERLKEEDRQHELARIAEEQARIALEKKRAVVATNRTAALKSQHPVVALKSNKILQNVTVASFNDDSISFTDATGGARVPWAELPDEWVEKFRDPVAAEAANKVKSEDAALLAQIEKAGGDVQITFVRELTANEAQDNSAPGVKPVKVGHTMGSGSIVNVVSYKVEGLGWKENKTSYIFLMGLSQSAFSQGPILKMRIYPLPEKILFYLVGKNGAAYGGDRVPSFCGSPAQSLQLMHDSGMSVAELVKRHYGSTQY